MVFKISQLRGEIVVNDVTGSSQCRRYLIVLLLFHLRRTEIWKCLFWYKISLPVIRRLNISIALYEYDVFSLGSISRFLCIIHLFVCDYDVVCTFSHIRSTLLSLFYMKLLFSHLNSVMIPVLLWFIVLVCRDNICNGYILSIYVGKNFSLITLEDESCILLWDF